MTSASKFGSIFRAGLFLGVIALAICMFAANRAKSEPQGEAFGQGESKRPAVVGADCPCDKCDCEKCDCCKDKAKDDGKTIPVGIVAKSLKCDSIECKSFTLKGADGKQSIVGMVQGNDAFLFVSNGKRGAITVASQESVGAYIGFYGDVGKVKGGCNPAICVGDGKVTLQYVTRQGDVRMIDFMKVVELVEKFRD